MNNVKELVTDQLAEFAEAEKRIKKVYAKMRDLTMSVELRQAFENQIRIIDERTARLDIILTLLEIAGVQREANIPKAFECELASVLERVESHETRDTGFIILAKKAFHYETVMIDVLRQYAHRLDHEQAETVLSDILQNDHRGHSPRHQAGNFSEAFS